MFNSITRNKHVMGILISVCFLGGLYQGMLMPLLSMLLEQKGTTATLNGINASALYLGILAAAPFMEKSLYRFGFKPILVFGTLALSVQLAAFPLLDTYGIWLALRFSMGLINHAVFYVILIWLGVIAPAQRRGRYLSYFGFAFGAGFSLGPLLAGLKSHHPAAPFMLTSLLCLCGTGLICLLKDRPPDPLSREISKTTLLERTKRVWGLAWFALLMPFGYGFMESVISAGLPVFLTRHAVNNHLISMTLACFFLSGLVTQLPLGRLSDALGRKKTFILILVVGISGFAGAAASDPSMHRLNLLFFSIAGGALGSTYSLGVTYVADSIPAALLPAGNMLCSVAFGLGSLSGPFIGGLFIDRLPGLNFAWLLVALFSLILLGIIRGNPGTDAAVN